MAKRMQYLVRGGMLLGLLAAIGCGGTSGAGPRATFIEFDATQKQTIESSVGRAYRIQEGDVLSIAFPYENNLTQEGITVLSDGAVSLVGVDRIEVEGRTLAEADSIVTAAYAKEYVEPNLSVIVQKSTGRRVYVLGEVKNAGLVQVPQGGVGVVGAVALAGGFTEDAAKGGTVLVRVTPEGYLVQEVDLDALNLPGNVDIAMINLEPYDIIYVPRSRTGDFGYFSRTILQGLVNITRIAADLKFISGVSYGGRY